MELLGDVYSTFLVWIEEKTTAMFVKMFFRGYSCRPRRLSGSSLETKWRLH